MDDDQLSAHPAWFPSPLQRERDAYRRGRARRSIVIAAVSTVVFLAAAVYAVTSSPGWPRVRDSFFDLQVARVALPRSSTASG